MSKLTPVLMGANVKESIAFYSSVFGFESNIIAPSMEEPVFASIEKDGVEIMLQEKNSMAAE